jgi:hypothetical protein
MDVFLQRVIKNVKIQHTLTKEKNMKLRMALLVDHVSLALQARDFCTVKKNAWGKEEVIDEVFDMHDLINYAEAHWDIRSVDFFSPSRFWERTLARDKRMVQNALGSHNIHLSTRPRKSPDDPNPVDEKLIEFARRRIRGVGKEVVDGIIIASGNSDFDGLLSYAANKDKKVHFIAYAKSPYKHLGAVGVTILRDLITPKYR